MPRIDFQPIDFQPEQAAPPQNPDLIPIEQRTLQQAADAAPDMLKEWATTVAPMVALPAFLGGAAKAAPAVARGAAAVLDNPIGGAIAGGISGYATGGTYGAGIGAMGGLMGGGSKIADLIRKLTGPNVAKGMSSAAQQVDDLPPALSALMRGGNADDLAAAVSKPAAKAASTGASLENELAKRIDWRTTDAVPIDAMKSAMGQGGSIIEAGESIPGLADRMAALLKQNTPTAIQEAQTLAKALRQRGHITAKGTR